MEVSRAQATPLPLPSLGASKGEPLGGFRVACLRCRPTLACSATSARVSRSSRRRRAQTSGPVPSAARSRVSERCVESPSISSSLLPCLGRGCAVVCAEQTASYGSQRAAWRELTHPFPASKFGAGLGEERGSQGCEAEGSGAQHAARRNVRDPERPLPTPPCRIANAWQMCLLSFLHHGLIMT